MNDQPTDRPAGGEPQATAPQLPPVQFLMFPEGFKFQPTMTPIGPCLAITGVNTGSPGVEATLMVPLESVDAFCDAAKANAKPPSGLVTADATTDVEALAREARERSGL